MQDLLDRLTVRHPDPHSASKGHTSSLTTREAIDRVDAALFHA
jgi:hypothetical protein